jgi:large subunit ribosomal protein L25
MTRPKLSATPRETIGKAVKRLRRSGVLPAVLYGPDLESRSIQLDAHEFELLRRRAGRNALLDLSMDGDRPQPVLLHAVQEHPLTRKTLHVDFLAVNMRAERTVDVSISMVGESEAVDKLGGVLLHLRDAVQVRALPDDLPPSLELDISSLDTFDAVLHASDLVVPAGVTLVTDATEAVARVQPPRVEEAPEPTEEEAAAAEAEEAAEGAEVPAAEGIPAEPGEPEAAPES